jgi:hypothetical protein
LRWVSLCLRLLKRTVLRFVWSNKELMKASMASMSSTGSFRELGYLVWLETAAPRECCLLAISLMKVEKLHLPVAWLSQNLPAYGTMVIVPFTSWPLQHCQNQIQRYESTQSTHRPPLILWNDMTSIKPGFHSKFSLLRTKKPRKRSEPPALPRGKDKDLICTE